MKVDQVQHQFILNKQYIKDKLSLLPLKPGCYLMKNKEGTVIYVGKAKKLKNRVSSYFTGTHNYKTTKLVLEIDDFEYIVTDSEKEALLLEINLIKDYAPKYNICFMDNKYYPYIQLTKERHPQLKIVRNAKDKKLYGATCDYVQKYVTDNINSLDKKYATKSHTHSYTTKSQVESIVRSMVKSSALK